MTQSATVKIPGNVSLNGGELQNAKLQSLVSKDTATEADFWYDSVNHKPVYHNGTTVKDFGKEYSNFTGADGTNAGTAGLVPAPSATDNTKFLCGDGTFKTPVGTTYTFTTGLTTTEGNIVSVSDYNKLVKNIASNAESIEIGGSSTNKTEAVSLGKNSSAGAGYSTAIGYKAEASGLSSTALGHKAKVTSGSNAIAIGNNAVASAVDAIQIGKGTISTQKTLSIGFGDSNYALLNGNTGKIPDERLSTAIARTTDIGNGVTVFKKNGTAFATTTANQTSAVNVDYTVPTTVAELSDSSNYALKSDVASAVIPKGSISAVSGLPTLVADHRGWMYNFDTAFTTTSDFVEGSGKKYPAGTNVVVVEYSSGTYKYDVFSGFVDTTTYDSHVANTTIHVTSTEKSTWNGKQDAISDLTTIRANATAGAAAATTIAGYGNVVTHNTSEFATAAQGTKADSACQKYTTINPALTSSNGVVTWTITNNATTADVDVSIYEVGSTSNTKIYPAIDVSASNIVMTMLSSSNVSAGALKAVTVG